ncbi:hypothetical protein FQA39_LY13360 [Lamprigera yunnana]|nr:hypothetical protein FQA39_LY13360 [Lamprigera yunnana]
MDRGALNLLSAYGDDSSDDELPRARISIKRWNSAERNSSKRLPVPELVYAKSKKDDTPVGDLSLYDGRIRSFPHERGNWVTYVYVPYESFDESMCDAIIEIFNSTLHITLHPSDHFHISLTKTVILKHHWIEIFMQTVREKLVNIKKFAIIFDSLKVYCNEERTRTFVALQIKGGYDALLRVVKLLDSSLADFRLPQFYKDHSFHMSIGWCVGDHENEINRLLPNLDTKIQEQLTCNLPNSLYTYVTQLECKCGNKLFTFNLT